MRNRTDRLRSPIGRGHGIVEELLRDGRTTDEIAQGLGVSPVTVRRHIARLLARMNAPDRESAIQALRMYGR